MARVEMYKGVSAEKLKDISMDEFMKMIDSRSRRTLKRLLDGKNIDYDKLVKKVRKHKKEGKTDKTIKTKVREAVILPEWIGLTFGVYNGKEYKNVKIEWNMVGYRLGDFAHTTSRVLHSGPGVGATRGSKFVPLK